MTYKDIINKLEALALDHVFIKQFGYGNISDIAVPEDQEAPDYPYMFINPTDISRGRTSFTFTFNLIMMTQVEDTEDAELLGQSRCVEYIQDIMGYFTNSDNEPLYDISLPYSIVPFKERLQDDVVGATATITMTLANSLSYCDTPFSSGAGAKSLVLPTATVYDGDGTVHQVAVDDVYTCLPATAKEGIFYQRIIPWDQNDPGIDGSVYWHKTQGTYNYAPPKNPLYVAALPDNYNGDDTNCLLMSNNAFGNKFRFTNDVGEQFVESFAESGTNTSSNPRYCIDHLTGLAWYVEDAYNDAVHRTLEQAITHANNFSYAGFSDWRLADIGEYLNSVNYNDWTNSYPGTYAPFVDPNIRNYGGSLWTGTFTKDNETLWVRTNGPVVERTTNLAVTRRHTLMVRNHYI